MTLSFYAGAWLAGVIAAALSGWPLGVVVGLASAGAVAGLVLGNRRNLALAVGSLAAVLLLGLTFSELRRPPPDSGTSQFNDRDAVGLRGTVVDEPEQRDTSQRLKLRVESLQARQDGPWQATKGGVLVTARPFPVFSYGDKLELHGKLKMPPRLADFDYREYLARRGIQSLSAYPSLRRTGTGGGNDIVRTLAGVRGSLGRALERSLPEPESALARGILLGERASIPRDLTDDFNDAGISHLVAISGYNVMLVAGLALGLLSPLAGRRYAILASMALVVLFALFVGATPSVLRAAVMAEVLLGASLAGRPNSARDAVFLAGAGLTAVQPWIVDDVSFQLSFAATLGIVLLAKPLEERLRAVLPGAAAMLAEPVAITIAAGVAAQPVIAASFGRISLVSLPANLLAVPAFPVIMACSAVTSVIGLVSQGAGRMAGEVTYLPLAYLVWLGRGAADLQSLALNTPGSLAAFGLAGALGTVFLVAPRKWLVRPSSPPPTAPRVRPALWASLAVLVIAGFVWRDTLSADEAQLTVSVLDVGQGDAILIETPAGQRILVDGGPSANRLNQALGRELPASAHRIDLMVLTHGQDDHVTGLVSVLERYDVKTALTTPLAGRTAAYQAWRASLTQHRVPLRTAANGQWIDLGGGARIEVLGPPARLLQGTDDDVNNSSVVLRLVYGEISFLLTGDLAAEGEQAVLAGGAEVHATVLKVGHHGSDGSSKQAFLSAVQPRLAVVSVGADNTYGHPAPGTRLRLADVPLLRTDHNGDIRLLTDGKRLSVYLQRGRESVSLPGAVR